jgi:hypothetical protein
VSDLAQRPDQSGPDLGEQEVAVVVSEGVVDVLEPVQVDQ